MPRSIPILAAAAALLAMAAPILAASLQIGPVRVLMADGERAATVSLRNVDNAPVTVQVRSFDWTQPNGEDALTPSSALIASPPLISLGPGQDQVVRLVLREAAPVAGERAFRLVLDEVPNPRQKAGPGVQATLRALVPVFVTSSTHARSKLRWTAARSGTLLRLTVFNDGDGFDRLLGIEVASGGRTITTQPLDGYVLSKASRSWDISADGAAGPLTVTGEGEQGPIRADVPVAP